MTNCNWSDAYGFSKQDYAVSCSTHRMIVVMTYGCSCRLLYNTINVLVLECKPLSSDINVDDINHVMIAIKSLYPKCSSHSKFACDVTVTYA